MIKIKLADMVIAIENRYRYLELQCIDYILPPETPEDLSVFASEEEIDKTIALSSDEIKDYPDLRGYAESVCVYRAICMHLPEYDAFLFHSVAIDINGKAYLFSAPSGIGKSTHLRLLMQEYKNKVTIINGDKPILRYKNGIFTVYGTPWAGKEGWQQNRSAPLAGICFLVRGNENRIKTLSPKDASDYALKQILYPKDPNRLFKMLSLTDTLLLDIPTYLLHCTISSEAARLSYRTMVEGK